MNKKVKALLLVLCALILVVGSVMGTLAYLTSQDSVTNTFTVGKVGITMVEFVTDAYGVKGDTTTDSGNEYKLIPGHEYSKEPVITVDSDSENAYIFVKIDNGLGTAAAIPMEAGWAAVPDVDGVWVYGAADAPTSVVAAQSVTPFKTFTFSATADPEDYDDKEITITAYAIQADGFAGEDAKTVWTALDNQLNPTP